MILSPRIRETVVFGCPYHIGPIYFDYRDVLRHMREEHPDWKDPCAYVA